jgi:hypothetical protein
MRQQHNRRMLRARLTIEDANFADLHVPVLDQATCSGVMAPGMA